MWLLRRVRWTLFFILICLLVTISLFKSLNQDRNHHVFHDGGIRSFQSAPQREVHYADDGGCRANHNYPKVDDFAKLFTSAYSTVNSIYRIDNGESYTDFLWRLNSHRTPGVLLMNAKFSARNSLEKFYTGIDQKSMYDLKNYALIEQLLKEISTLPIINAKQQGGGTSPKLRLTFSNGAQGIFKPMRVSRKSQTNPDHYYYHDTERHNAEIAAFHLDKVLGFTRAVPTVGRVLNIKTEIQQVVDKNFNITFYTSEGGNLCFFFDCLQKCQARMPLCGHPLELEGSITVFLPSMSRNMVANPYKRSYYYRKKTPWEKESDYCDKQVKNNTVYNATSVMLDLMDLSVYDFLIGNLDRHDYDTFRKFGTGAFIIHLDQGRGFGKSYYDCMSCLAPLQQCCMIRLSTISKLIKLYQGPDSLSHVMRESMTSDPVSPVLWEAHLDALDRRVGKIIKVVRDCVTRKGGAWESVLIDDLQRN